jgi:Zn-dependent M28 family amino/carboxypeptidase
LSAMKRSTYVDSTLVNVRLAAEDDGIPVIRLSEDLSRKLLAASGLKYDDVLDAQKAGTPIKPAPLTGSARIELAVDTDKVTTQNVVGVLRGSDRKLRDEYIVFSAHYDHLGPGSKGEFYPGADDDGSGTSAVLGIAKAMAEARPKRSVLIIFHAGEELGLLGSKHNADFAPIVPLGQMVVNINMDMIGRSKPFGDDDPKNAQMTDANTIYVIGADRTSKELHRLHERTNDEVEDLRLDYTLNDAKHPDQIFFRSDHWNYGKHGVPFIFYFDGVGEDYHQPTDTVDKIDYKKLTRVARLAFAIGLRIANLPQRLPAELKAAGTSD